MKSRNIRLSLLFFVLCGLVLAFQASRALSEPAPEKSDAARILVGTLPRAHINHQPCNDQVATNALGAFLDALLLGG